MLLEEYVESERETSKKEHHQTMPSIIRDAEMYVLYAGLFLFALNVVPIGVVRRFGARMSQMMQLRIPLPTFTGDAKGADARPRSMALLRLIGWVFALLTLVSYGSWYRRYADPASALSSAPKADLAARWEYYFVKWRAERDLYIRATGAVAYLAMHVLTGCHDDAHRAIRASA